MRQKRRATSSQNLLHHCDVFYGFIKKWQLQHYRVMKMVDKTVTWLSIDRQSRLLKLLLRGCIITKICHFYNSDSNCRKKRSYMRLSPQTFDSGAWAIYHFVLRNKSLSIHGEKNRRTKRDREEKHTPKERHGFKLSIKSRNLQSRLKWKKNVEIYMEHLEVVIKLLKNC